MFRLCLFALFAVSCAPCASHAELLVAIKPGVMCASAEALARLTLRDGSSRSKAPGATAEDKRIAQEGGCIDFEKGTVVRTTAIRTNTSIVMFDPGQFNVELEERQFYVPNVDFTHFTSNTVFYKTIKQQCPEKVDYILTARGREAFDYGGFFATLPKPLRDRVDAIYRKADCEEVGGPWCMRAAAGDALAAIGHEAEWASYVCVHFEVRR